MNIAVHNMMIHRGTEVADRDALERVATPAATTSWTPIPHARLIDEVRSALTGQTIDVVAEQHALGHDGNRYFGILQVSNRSAQEDFAYVVGLRNSHDKSYPAGLVVGSRVLVCDNLAFSGEIQVARKHTCNILRDLQALTCKAVGFLAARWLSQEVRIGAYKECELTDTRANDLVIKSLDAGVITSTQIPKVLEEWRNPKHDEFQPRTAWSLFNSVTEVLKGGSVFTLPARSIALHGLFDHQTGALDRLAKSAGEN